VFVNIDQVPTGKSMYTVAVTDQPAGTPELDLHYDEVDVIAPSRATAAEVIAAADLDGYEGQRVIAVVNQSDAYVVVKDTQGNLR